MCRGPIGTVETLVVLHALGVPANLQRAVVVESLGMAARTAGCAIPGALAVQEGGFALAAMSIGLPGSAGLSLSLVNRVREVSRWFRRFMAGSAGWRLRVERPILRTVFPAPTASVACLEA
jgi:hypothetical protein